MFREHQVLTNVKLTVSCTDVRIIITRWIIDHSLEDLAFQLTQVKQPVLELEDVPEWQDQTQVVNEHVTIACL
ncbi:hypothetical protein D9M73_242380 [compost metagenome]